MQRNLILKIKASPIYLENLFEEDEYIHATYLSLKLTWYANILITIISPHLENLKIKRVPSTTLF